MTHIEREVVVSSDDVHQYYIDHIKDYANGPVEWSHIVTASPTSAQRVEALLKAGQSFSAVAKAYSTDRLSAIRGGRMPSTPIDKLDPAIAASLKILRKGQVSPIIKSSSGFEFDRKDTEIKDSYRSMDEVSSSIRSVLINKGISKRLADAAASVPATIDQKSLDSIVLSSDHS